MYADVSDIEDFFDGSENQLIGAFEGMKGLVDFSCSLSAPLQSLPEFQIYTVVPILAIMLILQLVGVYHTSQAMHEKVVVLANETARLLLSQDDDFVSTVTNLVDIDSTVAFGEEESDENEYLLMWFAIQSYLATALQIAIAFLMTQARAMAALANMHIDMLERKVNDQLKAAVGGAFESLFQKGFGTVKAKFLVLVHNVDRIEQPLRQVQEQFGAGADILGTIPAGADLLGKIPAGAGRFGKFIK
jgi:hypothetical protein